MEPKFVDNLVSVAATLGAQAKNAEIIEIDNISKIAGVPDKVPALLIRGQEPQVLPLSNIFDSYRDLPKRKKGTAEVTALESFIDLTNRHKTEHSAIFAETNWKNPTLTAIINYHHIGENDAKADYLDHRVQYSFPLSDEWKAWQENNAKLMSQEEFAYFIEDQIACLATPTEEEENNAKDGLDLLLAKPNKMFELSRGLTISVDSQVGEHKRLADGTGSITWSESHKDYDGKPLNIPGAFILSIAPFLNAPVIRVVVLLRYRVSKGSIKWLYQLYRPDLAITEAFNLAIEEVKEKTALPIFAGASE